MFWLDKYKIINECFNDGQYILTHIYRHWYIIQTMTKL